MYFSFLSKIELWTYFKIMFLIFVAVIMVGLVIKADNLIDKILNKEPSKITESEIVKIAENLMRIQNVANEQRFTNLLDKLEKSNSDALNTAKAYAKATDSRITALGQTVSSLKATFSESKPSDTYVDPLSDAKSYENYDLVRNDIGKEELPVGWVKYHPNWRGEDKLFQYHYPLDFYSTIVKTERPDGSFSYTVENWLQNDYIPYSRGKKYPLNMKSIEFEERLLKEKSFRFNPRLGLGGGITSVSVFPSIDISLFSYGRTEVDMDWRFLILGIGASGFSEDNTEVVGTFSPVMYNVGNFLPLVKNIFLGPVISVDTHSSVGYGGVLSVPF